MTAVAVLDWTAIVASIPTRTAEILFLVLRPIQVRNEVPNARSIPVLMRRSPHRSSAPAPSRSIRISVEEIYLPSSRSIASDACRAASTSIGFGVSNHSSGRNSRLTRTWASASSNVGKRSGKFLWR